MSPRIQPVKLYVRHVREPRQRMPVGVIQTAECPEKIPPGQSAIYMNIGKHIDIFIEEHELSLQRRQKHPHDKNKQQHTNQKHAARIPKVEGKLAWRWNLLFRPIRNR